MEVVVAEVAAVGSSWLDLTCQMPILKSGRSQRRFELVCNSERKGVACILQTHTLSINKCITKR